jgi:DNA-binding response OmpR family regulator
MPHESTPHDAVLVDARTELAAARRLCQLLATAAVPVPVIAVLNAAGLVVVSGQWAVHDILLRGAGPAAIDARLRLLSTRPGTDTTTGDAVVRGELVIDEATYTARLNGRALELTYTEF